MSHHLDGPADTTMMGVVHDALRRDIARLQTSLAGRRSQTMTGAMPSRGMRSG